jgi:hypothetical protein
MRSKLKRQRINSGNTSEDEMRKCDPFAEIKKMDPLKINLKKIFSDESKLHQNLMLALKKSMPPDLDSLDPQGALINFSLRFVKNFLTESALIPQILMPLTPCHSSLGSE